MSGRKTLTLRPIPIANPKKVELSMHLGLRFVPRKDDRYILQARVRFDETDDHTWVDIPLVPEVYA